jgi:hypothetical protein
MFLTSCALIGKTIEIISLILGNPCSDQQIKAIEESHDDKVVSKTTLIVVPTTLLGQWFDEFDTRVDKPASATPVISSEAIVAATTCSSSSSVVAAVSRSSSLKLVSSADSSSAVIDLCSSNSDSNEDDSMEGKVSPTVNEMVIVSTVDDGSEEEVLEDVAPITAAFTRRGTANVVVREVADPPESFVSVLRLDHLQVKAFFSCHLHLIRYKKTESSPPSRWGYELDGVTPIFPKKGDILEYRVVAPYAIGRVILHVEFRQMEYNGKS